MPDIPQRWLSLSGLCNTLNLLPYQIKRLYNQKLLVRIGKRPEDHRYLDPTPEYAEKLRLAAVLLSKQAFINVNLPMSYLLTIREVAEILGWSLKHAQTCLAKYKIPCIKSSNRVKLYTAASVRNLIWKRQGRKIADKTAPLLLSEMILFFKRFQAAEEAIVPTDSQFAEDADLQKKITWLMRQPNRDVLLADFVSKMELARQVVAALGTTSPGESDTRQ